MLMRVQCCYVKAEGLISLAQGIALLHNKPSLLSPERAKAYALSGLNELPLLHS
jgi:hypothetical protein